jgi:hypothetical protein
MLMNMRPVNKYVENRFMRTLLILSALFSLFLWCGPATSAKEIIINDGFELGSWEYFTSFGSPDAQFITAYDVKNGFGGPEISLCFSQRSSGGKGGNDGGLRQDVFVQAGVTYVVSADICYHNC